MPHNPIAQDIRVAAFEALVADHHGRIGPRTLVDAARDPSSPFHDLFEWDDAVGAEQYRLIQAGSIIRRWKGSIMRIDQTARTVTIEVTRRLQSPQAARTRGADSYEATEQIMADPAKRENMLQTVLRELAAYQRRYRELDELADVWEAIENAQARVRGPSGLHVDEQPSV